MKHRQPVPSTCIGMATREYDHLFKLLIIGDSGAFKVPEGTQYALFMFLMNAVDALVVGDQVLGKAACCCGSPITYSQVGVDSCNSLCTRLTDFEPEPARRVASISSSRVFVPLKSRFILCCFLGTGRYNLSPFFRISFVMRRR